MIIYFVLLVIMTLTASLASFFLKRSTSGGSIISIVRSQFLYAGGFLYIIASLINIWLLQRMSYSIVVPFGSLSYIWTMFIAYIFLQEKIGSGKVIGIFLIISGLICIGV